MKRLILILVASIFNILSNAQNNPIFLRWKIQPNENLFYKVLMNPIDTLGTNKNSFAGLYNLFADSNMVNSDDNGAVKKLFDEIGIDTTQNLLARLFKSNKGIINIEIQEEPKATDNSNLKIITDERFDDIQKNVRRMNEGIQLRGAITAEGSIQSFYVTNNQRNLLAIFFELPAKQINLNESWSLDVHFLDVDQNFICDSSFRRNKVTLTKIKKQNSETIAVLKYEIREYIDGTVINPYNKKSERTWMDMSYSGIAEFSLEKGRWVSFDGLMSLVSNGVMTQNNFKKIKLIAQ